MASIRTKSEYENLRKARISDNQARLEEALGLQKTISGLRSITTEPKSEKRKWTKTDYSSSPMRRSNRLKGSSVLPGEEDCKSCGDLDMDPPCIEMEEVRAMSVYEELRKARISENQARLESLGLQKTISELRSFSPKPKMQKRKGVKTAYSSDLLRRSSRLKGKPCDLTPSMIIENESNQYTPSLKVKMESNHRPSPYALARRCSSKARGSVYDPVYGICCHFCRQKKLCGEEDCKRCGDLDLDQPCIGKTDCSLCHSSNGVLCRACLMVRYGEEMEEVRANKEWICPHCAEEKGINPFWICNSSLCLKKRRMAPTGIAIYRAREMGFKSVAHLLMDELQKRAGMYSC